MPRFNYIAIDTNGKTSKGSITAETSYAARRQLRSRNIHPTSIKQVTSEQGSKAIFLSLFGKGIKTIVLDFTKQLSTLLGAGIKLTEALTVLIQQTSDARFKNTLVDIRDRVVTGESFTEALGDYTDYFDIIYISMIRVGEVTGTLGDSLTTMSKFMEKRQRVASQLITAMVYPIILMVFCLIVIIVLTTVVIPKIATQIANHASSILVSRPPVRKRDFIKSSYSERRPSSNARKTDIARENNITEKLSNLEKMEASMLLSLMAL